MRSTSANLDILRRRQPWSPKMFVLGSARLDPEKHLLITGSGAVALQRKPYLVLRYLIENRHRMILRKELLDQFWDGKNVYDQSLSKAVSSIRKAFGETRDSSIFIETRWGIGYRYVGPFDEPLAVSPASLFFTPPPNTAIPDPNPPQTLPSNGSSHFSYSLSSQQSPSSSSSHAHTAWLRPTLCMRPCLDPFALSPSFRS